MSVEIPLSETHVQVPEADYLTAQIVLAWTEPDGSLHAILPGDALDEAQVECPSKSSQDSIRTSPVWADMVKESEEAKAEKVLTHYRAEVRP